MTAAAAAAVSFACRQGRYGLVLDLKNDGTYDFFSALAYPDRQDLIAFNQGPLVAHVLLSVHRRDADQARLVPVDDTDIAKKYVNRLRSNIHRRLTLLSRHEEAANLRGPCLVELSTIDFSERGRPLCRDRWARLMDDTNGPPGHFQIALDHHVAFDALVDDMNAKRDILVWTADGETMTLRVEWVPGLQPGSFAALHPNKGWRPGAAFEPSLDARTYYRHPRTLVLTSNDGTLLLEPDSHVVLYTLNDGRFVVHLDATALVHAAKFGPQKRRRDDNVIRRIVSGPMDAFVRPSKKTRSGDE